MALIWLLALGFGPEKNIKRQLGLETDMRTN
jgi:hypothetical protein